MKWFKCQKYERCEDDGENITYTYQLLIRISRQCTFQRNEVIVSKNPRGNNLDHTQLCVCVCLLNSYSLAQSADGNQLTLHANRDVKNEAAGISNIHFLKWITNLYDCAYRVALYWHWISVSKIPKQSNEPDLRTYTPYSARSKIIQVIRFKKKEEKKKFIENYDWNTLTHLTCSMLKTTPT